MENLPKSVKDFEPHLALFGGEDGLDFYRKLAVEAPKYLNTGGIVYLEVGDTEAEKVVSLFEDDFDCRIAGDSYGFDRYVIARSRK